MHQAVEVNEQQNAVFRIKVVNLVSWGLSIGTLVFLFGQTKAKLEHQVQENREIIKEMSRKVGGNVVLIYRVEDLTKRVEKLEGR